MLNLCFISAEENCKFGAKAPVKYLDEYRGDRHFQKVMIRHLMPHDEDAGLWQPSRNGYAKFLKQREQLVCKAFEAAAGIKLFKREQVQL